MKTDQNTSPGISIVIPVFNRAHVIRPTIDSVINQTFENWELIIVDDCSNDFEKLKQLIKSYEDKRIVLLRHNENRNGSAARNTGINASRAEILALLDSDDLWEEDKLESCLPELTVQTDVVYSQVCADKGIYPSRGIRENERVDEYLMLKGGSMQTSTLMLFTAFAKRVMFDESLKRFQDYDFVIRLQSQGARFKFVNRCLAKMTDIAPEQRISKQTNVEPALFWLDKMAETMSVSAQKAFYLWRIVRLMVLTSQKQRIFRDMPLQIKSHLSTKERAILIIYRLAPILTLLKIRDLVKSH